MHNVKGEGNEKRRCNFFFKFNPTGGMEAIGGVLVHTGHTGNHHGVCVCGGSCFVCTVGGASQKLRVFGIKKVILVQRGTRFE